LRGPDGRNLTGGQLAKLQPHRAALCGASCAVAARRDRRWLALGRLPQNDGRRIRRSGGLPGIPQYQFAIEMPPARVKASLRRPRSARHYKCRSGAS